MRANGRLLVMPEGGVNGWEILWIVAALFLPGIVNRIWRRK